MHQLVQLVNEGVGVAPDLGGIGEVNVGGELVGGAGQQLPQAVKGTGHITSASGSGYAVDDEVVEVVAGGLDLFRQLEGQLIHSAGGVLDNTVDLERTAHDDGLGGLLRPLCLIGGILAVDCTNSGGGGGLELDVAVGQGRPAGTGRNGVVEHQPVQQKRAPAELIDDHLVDLIGHTDLGFSESNRHNSVSFTYRIFRGAPQKGKWAHPVCREWDSCRGPERKAPGDPSRRGSRSPSGEFPGPP